MRRKTAPQQIDAVTAYANSVVSGRVPACKLVIKACERHLRDLVEGPQRGLVWRPEKADWAIKFIGLFSHSKGEWAGQRLKLEPWAQFVVGSVFGWVREDGRRRFRRVYEELPRKNGKSTKLAAIGLYMLIAEREPGAEVYAAATKRDQARIIFDEARRMARGSPAVRDKLKVNNHVILYDGTQSKFEPLSADARTLDGLNPFSVLIDEVHKHKTREVIDVLETALGARRQPLLWMITTAGDDDPESPYAHENLYAIQILDRAIEDDSTFAFICTIDESDRWDDPLAWAKANPNLGVSVSIDYIRDQASRARNVPSAMVSFKRLHLNVRTADSTKAIDGELWAKNNVGLIDARALRGRPCFMAVDLSSKLDLSACVRLFPPENSDERWKVLARFWMPSADLQSKEDRDRVPYRRWVDDGWIIATPGNVVDQEAIKLHIVEDAKEYPPTDLAIDPWNAYGVIPYFQDQGIKVVEFIQGLRSYTAPTKELLNMLHAERFDFGCNPVMTWMASNLHIQTDKNENQMPTKKHSRGRIDGMTSLIMAIGRAINEENASSIFDRTELWGDK